MKKNIFIISAILLILTGIFSACKRVILILFLEIFSYEVSAQN